VGVLRQEILIAHTFFPCWVYPTKITQAMSKWKTDRRREGRNAIQEGITFSARKKWEDYD